MNVVELLEKKHFKAIERSIKRRKLQKYFFALYRYNTLYKGKNKAVGKLWRDISSEGGEYLDTVNTFSFVNFKYVCDFVKRLGGERPPEWVDGQDGQHSLEWPHLPRTTLGDHIERDRQRVADLFLAQLFRVVGLHARAKRGSGSTRCGPPHNGSPADGDQQSITANAPLLTDIPFTNQKREFEILLSLVHPLVHNIYVANLVADVVVKSPRIDMDQCYMQLLLSVLLHLYKRNKDVLFFYFIIYKKWKGVRKNICNSVGMILEWEAIKFIKKKNKKDIHDFKCLRYFLLNLCDRSAIHRLLNYVFSFLRSLFFSNRPNNWEVDFWTYRRESNYYEFAFFLFLSVEDLCDEESVFFAPPLEGIKKLLLCEQETFGMDVYLLLHFIERCACELSVKLRLTLVSLIRCAGSPDLFRQHGESFFRAVLEPAGERLPDWQPLSGAQPMGEPLPNGKLPDGSLPGGIAPPEQRRIAQFVSTYLTGKDELIARTTKKEAFFNAPSIVKYIHVSCYNAVNNRREHLVKFDPLESERETSEAHPYEYNLHSDVSSYKGYLSSSVSGHTSRKYATLVSILLHMNLLRLSDLWSFTLTKLVENNVTFQLMNLLRLRGKGALLCLTVSSVLKVSYEAVQAYARGGCATGGLASGLGGGLGGGLTSGLTAGLTADLGCQPVAQPLPPRRALRKAVLEYATNESKLMDILCYLSMSVKKDLLKMPLIIIKVLFKNILKYLSKPIHDVKKSIRHYFDRMALRIIAYLFELMLIMSKWIYHQGEVQSMGHYRKKFHLFPVYFILIDVYVKFAERYSEKNNAVLPSLLSYSFVKGFLFLFDYPGGTSLMGGRGLSRGSKAKDTADSFLGGGHRGGKKSRLLRCARSGYPLTWRASGGWSGGGSQRGSPPPSCRLTQMDDMNMAKQSHHSYADLPQTEGKAKRRGVDLVQKESTFDEDHSQHIISITNRFIEANGNEVCCYFYTLLLFAIARIHTSVCYRYREINYLLILHVLPWKSCLHFCRRDSQLSCFFLQKWYECVHALLPEIAITQFSPKVGQEEGEEEEEDEEEEEEEGESGDDRFPFNFEDTRADDSSGGYPHVEASNGLYAQIVRARAAMKRLFLGDADENTTISPPDGALIMGMESSLLRNCLLVSTLIEAIFMNGGGMPGCGAAGNGPTGNGPTGNGPTGNGPTGNGPTGNGPTPGADPAARPSNFAQVVRALLNEQLCAHYISVFQNPLNFFLRISPKCVELLVRHNCLGSLVGFVFAKLQSYLSLMPPRLCAEDFLPLNVEDITALQETAVAQLLLGQRGGVEVDGGEAVTLHEAGRRATPLFDDLSFFLKKMDALVKTLSAGSLQSLCESGFDAQSAFYLSFYIRPPTFHTVFHYLANNMMAITSDTFNLGDNANYYKQIHIREEEPVLKPFNILNKTAFYTQLVVFYLIINANNERMEVESYKKNLSSFFRGCLQGCFRPYVDEFVASIMPAMLQFYYFFPSLIPEVLGALGEVEMRREKELLCRQLARFEKRVRRVLEVSYVHSAQGGQREQHPQRIGAVHSAGV
ncbi:conserved Plasmodium protein, unknown function [Plasmodium vivax]|uniref:Uncharacterized protein n=1 Tax=Plasmodium vivax TaxID=5855 RepID=A0A1G4HKM6_PLAVI|nr:conserved Plasmodium protein, unknown function [Plasmodium vivax]